MKLDARIAYAVARAFCRLVLRWTVSGRELVPEKGSLVLVANHVHNVDPLLLLFTCPRPLTFLAKEELFRIPFIGMLMRDAGMFPVARAGTLQQKRDVMRQAENLLAEGRALAIFPEGKRSPSGVMIPARAGATFLALHSGATLLPVAIAGTEQLIGPWWFRRPRVSITFGPPFALPESKGPVARSVSAQHTDLVMRSIAVLLPEDRRGPYAD